MGHWYAKDPGFQFEFQETYKRIKERIVPCSHNLKFKNYDVYKKYFNLKYFIIKIRVPSLLYTAKRKNVWLKNSPGEEVPRLEK